MATVIREDPGQFTAGAVGAAKIATLIAERKRLKTANQLAKQQLGIKGLESALTQQEGIADLVGQFVDPFNVEVTDIEANEMIEAMTPQLQGMGVPLDPINKDMLRTLIQSKSQQIRKGNELLEMRNRAIAAAQLAQAGSRADPATIMEIGVVGNRLKNLDDLAAKTQDQINALSTGAEDLEGTEREVLDRNLAKLHRDLETIEQQKAESDLDMADLRRRQIGVPRQSQVPRTTGERPDRPDVKADEGPQAAAGAGAGAEIERKRVFVTSQEQFDRLPKGTPIGYVLKDGTKILRIKD